MKVRDVIKRLHADGWVQIDQTGDHRQYKHPVKRGKVTVAGQMSDEVRKKTLKSIWQQAGLEPIR
jgi:predicted RNA binding protein YcfA (HicA-like mRNA interferase family)